MRSAVTDRFSLQLRHKLAHGLGDYRKADCDVLFDIVCLFALTCAIGPPLPTAGAALRRCAAMAAGTRTAANHRHFNCHPAVSAHT